MRYLSNAKKEAHKPKDFTCMQSTELFSRNSLKYYVNTWRLVDNRISRRSYRYLKLENTNLPFCEREDTSSDIRAQGETQLPK